MSGALIRPADARDCPALAALIGQLGYPVAVDDLAQRLAGLAREGRPVLVAEIDGTVVGCLSTSVMHVLHRPKPVGRISMMVVDEGLRGGGIGTMLVRAAEAALVARGCGLIEVTSNLRREAAHGFYERLGYQRTSLRFARDAGDAE